MFFLLRVIRSSFSHFLVLKKHAIFRDISLNEDYIYPSNISPTKALLKMIFLFPRWDMLYSLLEGISTDSLNEISFCANDSDLSQLKTAKKAIVVKHFPT